MTRQLISLGVERVQTVSSSSVNKSSAEARIRATMSRVVDESEASAASLNASFLFSLLTLLQGEVTVRTVADNKDVAHLVANDLFMRLRNITGLRLLLGDQGDGLQLRTIRVAYIHPDDGLVELCAV